MRASTDWKGTRSANGGSVLRRRRPTLGALLLLSAVVGFAEVRSQVDENSQKPARVPAAEQKDAGQTVREAIRLGHVLPGMSREQVTAALGEPIRKIRSAKTPGLEHWLYRMEKLHQEQFRGRGWSFVRITFRDGRVVAVDPR